MNPIEVLRRAKDSWERMQRPTAPESFIREAAHELHADDFSRKTAHIFWISAEQTTEERFDRAIELAEAEGEK